ncbi:kinase-like domain-containing protein [Irpex rosettiformis]|uniref:Kinase-like domain-containing protein n=1 Tax=Irpex rosettiformis TaxID=378272 RepID=A0ACB8TUK5_9APHY|nr:kinase-like domain-containing protein [Irpex rosettiformis]
MPSAITQGAASRKFIGAVEDEWQLYSDRAEDYTIGAPIGYGASSIVYAATFHPSNPSTSSQTTPCALKVVDLDRLPQHALRLLMQETQLMSLSKHPNVLRVRGTWMDGHKLYIALRLMNSGSAMDVMRYAWPGGMEEEVVRCILKQSLQGLNYLHTNGLMHRDVKAANLLIDDDGTVLLGDLGVAAPLLEPSTVAENLAPSNRAIIGSSSFNRPGGGRVFISPAPSHGHGTDNNHPHSHRTLGKRKSFVGTPCWMAPEVITGKQYDASADIWSFGITALELAHGRAPYSRSPPSVALTHIATSPPPKLDKTGGVHTYSAAFVEVVEMCLNKDPSKRPSAEELLAMPWFRGAKKKGYLVGAVLKGLPPLTSRQERQRIPSLMTHATMESWDFAVTQMGSPTTSVYSARSGWRKRNAKVQDDAAVYDVVGDDYGIECGREVGNSESSPRGDVGVNATDGEDASTYARRMRARHHARTGSGSGLRSRAHSRSVSLAESIHEDEEAQPAQEGLRPLSSSPPPITISEAELAPMASRTPSSEKKPETQKNTVDLLDIPGSSSSPPTSSSPSSRSSVAEAITPSSNTHQDIVGIAQYTTFSTSDSGAGRLWRKFISSGEKALHPKEDNGGGLWRPRTATKEDSKLGSSTNGKRKSGLGGLAAKVVRGTGERISPYIRSSC